MPLYDDFGRLNVTVVDGNSYVGSTALDGSMNVVIQDGSTFMGAVHPSGARNVVVMNDFLAPKSFSKPTAGAADAWSWFHEPRALAANGKTWFGTTGSDNNSVLTGRASFYEIDEATGNVLRKDMGTSTVAATWADDHDYPAPVLRPDGRLIVFYVPHRIATAIKYRISVSPYTMADGWSQEYSLGNEAAQATYPSPVILTGESNKLYLFYRNGSSSGPLSYVTSADIATVSPATVDGGALGATPTWAAERQLASSTGTQGIYHKVTSNNVDRIDFLCTDAVGPQASTKTDVRHFYYQGGQFKTSAGVNLGDGTTPLGFTNFTAVATSGAPDNFGDMWCCHIQRRTSGIIEAVFWRFISTSDHRCYYARWNGSAWSKVEVDAGEGMGVPDTRSGQITDGQGAVEGYYSPGAFFDTKEEGVLYISVGNANYSQVYRYITNNGGTTWTRQRVSSLDNENVRPVVPLNRSDKYAVLWMSGAYHYYDFDTNPAASDIGYTTNIKAASRSYVTRDAAPNNVSLPTVSGSTGAQGNVLQAAVGTWTGNTPLNFTYQWVKEGVDIPGATSSSYTVQSGDIAKPISVRVTGTNNQSSVSVTSAPAQALPTNLVANSGAFNLWTPASLSVVTNAANDPFGNLLAERTNEQAATTGHSITSANINFTAGTTYTFSFYVKNETAPYIQALFGSAAFGSNAWGNFDVGTGVVGTKGAAATTSIVDAGNGWYRCIMTAPATGTAAAPVALYMANSASMTRAGIYLGVVGNTKLIAAAQVETGGTANIYVAT